MSKESMPDTPEQEGQGKQVDFTAEQAADRLEDLIQQQRERRAQQPPQQPQAINLTPEQIAAVDQNLAEIKLFELWRRSIEARFLTDEYAASLKENDPTAYEAFVRGTLESLRIPPPPPEFTEYEEGATDDVERIEAQTIYGTKMEIVLPREEEQKMEWMRERLAFVERTQEGFTSSENFTYVNDIFSVIKELQKRSIDTKLPSEERQRSGSAAERMKKEVMARAALQDYFLIYAKSVDAGSIADAASLLKADHFNTLFRIKEVQQAFLLYEAKSKDFLRARGNTRERLQNEIAVEVGNGDLNHGRWAQALAERLWRITGRAAINDGLRVKDPTKPENEREYEFEGEGSGGDFVVRRILLFQDWLKTARKATPTEESLWSYVDLGANDLFSTLPGDMEGNIVKSLRGELGHSATADEYKHIQDQAKGVVEGAFSMRKQRPSEGNPLVIEDKWPKKIARLQNLNWNELNFNLLGEGFFGTYMFYNVRGPDGARDALVGKGESFMRIPTYDGLKATKEVFGYRGGDQSDVKAKLLEGFLKEVASTDKARKYGLIKADRATIKATIRSAAIDLGLGVDKAKETKSRVLGKGLKNELATLASEFALFPAFIAGILESLKRFFKASFQLK